MVGIVKEVEDIAERHGNARRSEGIDPPNEIAVETVKVEGRKVIVHGRIVDAAGMVYAEADCLCISIQKSNT